MSILTISQALEIAIESVEKREDIFPATKKEALEKLKKLSKKDWYKQWDKDLIINALKQFETDNGRTPSVTDLKEVGMPNSLTIQTYFHMSASKFLQFLFPSRDYGSSRKYRHLYRTTNDWLECFKQQFNKNIENGLCGKKYNQLRDINTPMWETIARHCGVHTWGELTTLAGVETPQAKRRKQQPLFIAYTTSPTIKRLEQLNKQAEELNMLLERNLQARIDK